MKRHIILFFIGMFALSACVTQPASSPEVTPGSKGEEGLPNNAEQPTQSVTEPPGAVDPGGTWDTDPEKKILMATYCCGFAPELVQVNYIPEAQIWGDGRIIWTNTGPENQRMVLEGRLDQEQLGNLLKGAADQGFFNWEERYSDPLGPTDLPEKCIGIEITGQSKRVCEYYKGAPMAFHELYDSLDNGAGVQGTDYLPKKGFLKSYLQPGAPEVEAGAPAIPTWDASGLGVSLADTSAGVWIEGPALEAAWKLVNERPFGPVVQEDGKAYQISLQIPGISFMEPPAQ